MGLVLQFFGVVFLLILMFIVVGVLYLRSKLLGMKSMLEQLGSSLNVTPPRIHLRTMAGPSFDDEESSSTRADALRRLGFAKIGNYEIEELDETAIEAWLHAGKNVVSVIYENPRAGIWTDFWTHFQDGTRMTYSDSNIGAGIQHAPGHTVERFPGLSLDELFPRFLADRPDKPASSITPEGFVEAFEKAYADEMDWRNSQGGPTMDEIRQIATLSGTEFDEETLATTHAELHQQALENLETVLRAQFLSDSGISAAEWENLRDRVIFIHDKLDRDSLIELADLWEDEVECPEVAEEGPNTPRIVFETQNRLRPEDDRYRKLGTVHQPIAADVYAGPE